MGIGRTMMRRPKISLCLFLGTYQSVCKEINMAKTWTISLELKASLCQSSAHTLLCLRRRMRGEGLLAMSKWENAPSAFQPLERMGPLWVVLFFLALPRGSEKFLSQFLLVSVFALHLPFSLSSFLFFQLRVSRHVYSIAWYGWMTWVLFNVIFLFCKCKCSGNMNILLWVMVGCVCVSSRITGNGCRITLNSNIQLVGPDPGTIMWHFQPQK